MWSERIYEWPHSLTQSSRWEYMLMCKLTMTWWRKVKSRNRKVVFTCSGFKVYESLSSAIIIPKHNFSSYSRMTIDVLLCDSAVTNFLLSSIIFIIINKSFFVWNNYRINILNSDKINDSNIDDNNDNNDIMVDKEFIDFTQNGMINTIVVDCTHPTAQQLTHHLKHPKQRYFIGYINVVYTHSCIFMHILTF